MTLAFIAVLMCMAGLFGVECYKDVYEYHGCNFTQATTDSAKESVRAAMDRLEPLRQLKKVYVSLPRQWKHVDSSITLTFGIKHDVCFSVALI